ncbi:hypothetical protein [Paraflavitalea speifideaquila]|uniref:hypothetical protein n=1 Tax=Paraflavitalea speifideaquila TaxID=3076558 RepID=UPI0028E423E0|nr:hypothetical protein [Paraflavitalea speifideiaquila]
MTRQVDSLKGAYEQNRQKVQRFKQLVGGRWEELTATRGWTDKLQEYGMGKVQVPAKYRWLMGFRQFSVGRKCNELQ